MSIKCSNIGIPLQDPPKFTQIGIFGLKLCRLATLMSVANFWYFNHTRLVCPANRPPSGLPDFSWYNLPKQGKIYQITAKYTKLP
jgi:hypothetical protein